MIRGEDILSKYPDSIVKSQAKGYVYKCDSSSGICFDILDNKYAHNGVIMGEFPRRKPRWKFYLAYVSTEYEPIDGSLSNDFGRTEYYLPTGELIFINDCHRGHGHCQHLETMKVVEIFNQYRTMTLRKAVKAKPKTKRVVKKCRCKK